MLEESLNTADLLIVGRLAEWTSAFYAGVAVGGGIPVLSLDATRGAELDIAPLVMCCRDPGELADHLLRVVSAQSA
jgi:hypothetical protein